MYGDLRPCGVSFDCCSNSALANSIAFAGTFSLSGPSGSGRVGEVDDATGIKLKYFRIPVS